MKGKELTGCKVAAMSVFDIRRCAEKFRSYVGSVTGKSGLFLERLIERGVLHIVPDDDAGLETAEACYFPDERCIYLRDRDYRGIAEGTNRRALFTLWHEIGHMLLGHDKKFARDCTGKLLAHKLYEDSEWQANTFAAEFLMPLSVIRSERLFCPDQLMEAFGVSRRAAEVRLDSLMRRREI